MDQVVVERPQLFEIWRLMTLGIKIVRVERLDPFEHFAVLIVHQVIVFSFAMRGVEGVITDHVKRFGRQIIFGHVIKIFVVAPGEFNAIETGVLLIEAEAGLVTRILAVGIVSEEFVENDFFGIRAADRESVADHSPLRFAKETENLAEIMDQAGQDEPARMTVAADLFGGLEEVIELGEIGVGIGVIDELVEEFERFPNAHLAAVEGEEVLALLLDEIAGLMAMIEPVKFADSGPGVSFVITELFLFLLGINGLERRFLGVAFLEKIFPLFKVGEGRRIIGDVFVHLHKLENRVDWMAEEFK